MYINAPRGRGAGEGAAWGIIMAVSKLKSRDMIEDNSIYHWPRINGRP